MTQRSGFAEYERFIKAEASIYLSTVFCCLPSSLCQKLWMTSKFKVTLCPLPSLPLTLSCLALGASGCHHCGSCQHIVPGWWPPGPSAEPSPHGWAQKRPWQCACRITKRTIWNRDTRLFLNRFSNMSWEIQYRNTGEKLSGWMTVVSAWITAMTMKMQ